jgi:NAD(P)H dehydrogenase (quinone)
MNVESSAMELGSGHKARATATIAVVGAAGVSGRHVLSALRDAGLATRALVHSADGAARATSAGAAETVIAEMADENSLAEGIEGVDAIVMIPPGQHPQEDVFSGNAVRAAQSAGVARFIYVSVLHPHTPTLLHHMRKADAEAELRHSRLDWTILAPGMFAQVADTLFCSGPAGTVSVPFDVTRRFAAIDLVDFGEIVAKVLVESGHEHGTYELVGFSETMADYIRTAARLRGVELVAQSVPPAEGPIPPRFRGDAAAEESVRAMFREYDQHGLQGNSVVLTALLGRAPHTFEDVVRRRLAS